ncbi:ATP-binding cassette domain-containing protein [Emticicia sp. TH156]|uniref:ABC transporter ATP-binding protein n=1 Tax=Emticicia sp. TH156 TaxID=2067454 RepID=UPI000C75E9E7|nr:ATP-binding cassette domain-containing protein [Emticicia sp. TH156]PLK42315.1 ABC transporter [Emticicia sp. TH156]
MLTIRNFLKSYNNHKILEIQHLDIPEGVHWVKGINGSGKSTLFRSIAGMVPFDGEISFRNLSCKRDTVAYRMIVNLSEAEPMYPDYLSGHDLLQFMADAKQDKPGNLNTLAESLGVNQYWKTPVSTYSSGMLKKISLVSAFLGSPRLIMLDEPLITIDDRSVEIIYELVKDTYENKGVSFLLSSHQDFRFEKLPIKNVYLVQNQAVSLL